MKYAQLLIGLLAGTALGGAVVAGTNPTVGTASSGTGMSREQIQQIVRDTIMAEPKVILDSVQKYQDDQRKKENETANESLKDKETRDAVFNYPDVASIGPKDSSKVVVEFFDYDCSACKMMFKSIDEVVKKDPSVRIIFREYPIFGPVSENNSKLGIAVNRLYPEKYFDFHAKMMGGGGHDANEKKTLGIIKDLGMDVAKVKAESQKADVQATIDATHKLGEKLGIRGTPTLVIGDEIVPHALSADDLEEKVNAIPAAKPAAEPDKK